MRPKSTRERRKGLPLEEAPASSLYPTNPLQDVCHPPNPQNISTCFRDEETEVHRAQQIKWQARCWPATALQALGPAFIWPLLLA